MLLGRFENLRTKDKTPILIKNNQTGASYTFCKSLYIRMEYYTLVLNIPNNTDTYFTLEGDLDNNKNFVCKRKYLLDTIDTIERTFEKFNSQIIVAGIAKADKGTSVISMMQKPVPLNMIEIFTKGSIIIDTGVIYLRLKEKDSKDNDWYSLPIAFISKRKGESLRFETLKECDKINVRLRMNNRYKKELYNVG